MNALITGIVGIVGLVITWVAVQLLWKKEFVDYLSDDDVLAGRSSCGNCGCTTSCQPGKNAISKELN